MKTLMMAGALAFGLLSAGWTAPVAFADGSNPTTTQTPQRRHHRHHRHHHCRHHRHHKPANTNTTTPPKS